MLSRIYIILGVVLSFFLIFFGIGLLRTSSPAFFNRFAAFMVPYTIIIFPLLIFALLSLLGKIIAWAINLCTNLPPIVGQVFEGFAIFVGVSVFLIMVVGHYWGPKHLVVREETVSSPAIPAAFDGYRIAHISDVHLISQKSQPEFIEEVVNRINALDVDAVCFTGDLVTATRQELRGYEKTLSNLRAKDGVFSVLGNHDYHMYTGLSKAEQQAAVKAFIEDQKKLGWNILVNENRILHRGNDSILIAGCENDGTPPHFPQYADLRKTLAGADSIPCKILLSHDPTHWRRAILPQTDILLTLSGHTHAMQFKILGWSPSSKIYQEWCGLYQSAPSPQSPQSSQSTPRFLNVSSGIGGAGLPFRFGAWPEICVITLRKQ